MKTRYLLTLGLASVAVLVSCNKSGVFFTHTPIDTTLKCKKAVKKTTTKEEKTIYYADISIVNKTKTDFTVEVNKFVAKKGETKLDALFFASGFETKDGTRYYSVESKDPQTFSTGSSGSVAVAFNEDISDYTINYTDVELPFKKEVQLG